MRITRIWAVAAALGLTVAACGGGDDEPSFGDLTDSRGADQTSDDEDLEDFADALNQAQGAGGGGTLTFDGTAHNIDFATCLSNGERLDIGTVGPDSYRVFVTGDPTDPNLQILTPEGIQWFDGDKFQDFKSTVTIDGNMVTATGGKFFNNQDDTLISAEFVIECPDDVL